MSRVIAKKLLIILYTKKIVKYHESYIFKPNFYLDLLI